MNREETFRLTQEVLTGINRVIETFQSLAPEGDALLASDSRVSDDDALFYGRVASALSILRACSNRLILVATSTGLSPKLLEVQRPSSPIPMPEDEDEPVVKNAPAKRGPARHKPGFAKEWLIKRLGKAQAPMLKADLVRLGVAAGMSDPSLYHTINKLVNDGTILFDSEGRLSVNRAIMHEPSEPSEE